MISNDDSPLTDTEVHYLRSEHAGDEFKIHVGHCGSPGSSPRPVLYLGDPSLQFGTAVEMVRLLNIFERLPSMLVVGIGYRTANNDEVSRSCDLATSPRPSTHAMRRTTRPRWPAPAASLRSSGMSSSPG